jgi:type VI secretion system secreted protein VgrG
VTAAAGATVSLINGDVGVSPGTSITGFPAAATTVPPFTTHANDALAISGQASVSALYSTLASLPAGTPVGPELSNLNLGPGTFSIPAGATLSSPGGPLTGNLTLSGAGNYYFKLASSLDAAVLSTVTLVGVDPCTVYWQVTSAATLNGVNFVGNVVAQAAVTLGSNAVLTGRALTTPAGAVTMAGGNTVGGCSTAAGAPVLPVPLPALSAAPTLTKGFNRTIAAGGVSPLVITVTNPNAATAILIAPLVDNLPAGLVIAATPNANTTCPGIGLVLANPGGTSVTLPATDVIPAASGQTPGSCIVSVDVTAAACGNYENTLPVNALRTSNGNNTNRAVAVLAVPCTGGAAPVPTLSEWATITLSLLLALAGFAAMRRRTM